MRVSTNCSSLEESVKLWIAQTRKNEILCNPFPQSYEIISQFIFEKPIYYELPLSDFPLEICT